MNNNRLTNIIKDAYKAGIISPNEAIAIGAAVNYIGNYIASDSFTANQFKAAFGTLSYNELKALVTNK